MPSQVPGARRRGCPVPRPRSGAEQRRAVRGAAGPPPSTDEKRKVSAVRGAGGQRGRPAGRRAGPARTSARSTERRRRRLVPPAAPRPPPPGRAPPGDLGEARGAGRAGTAPRGGPAPAMGVTEAGRRSRHRPLPPQSYPATHLRGAGGGVWSAPALRAGGTAARSPSPRPPPAACPRRGDPRLASPRSSSSPPPPPGEPGRAGPHLPPGRPEAATGPARCPPDPHCPPRCGLSRRPPSAAPRGCGDARGVPRRSPAPLCAEGLRCAETGRPRPGCWSSRPAQPPQRKSLCAYKRVLLKSPRTLLSLSLQMEKRRAETSLPQIATRLSHRLSRNLNFRPML